MPFVLGKVGNLQTVPPIMLVAPTSAFNTPALSCPKGGFPMLRHKEVRDLTANLMSEVCHDVCIEPPLQPVTGEALSGASAIREDGARGWMYA